MNQFQPLIRQISDQLRVPQPARARIVLEIAADLEGMYEQLQEQGLPPELAAAKARETFALSGDALTSLIRIHETPFRRLLDRLSEQARSAWERATLALLALFIILVTARLILAEQLLATASRFIWPVAGVAVLAAVTVLARGYSLYLKKDHEPSRLRSGLDLLLFLAATSLGLGQLGLASELYLVAQRIVADRERAFHSFLDFLQQTSAMLVVSTLVALAIGVLWFVLLGTVQRIERAEAAVLLQSNGDGQGPDIRSSPADAMQPRPSPTAAHSLTQGGLP